MKTNLLNEKVSTITEPYLEIKGGVPLKGKIEISGAKNAALPAIVAACLSEETVTLRNVPLELNDVKLIIDLLISMGAKIDIDENSKTLSCLGKDWKGGSLDPNIAGRIRHSLLLLGLSASWKTSLFLPMPGGCDLGSRKHDMHIDALQSLGNTVKEDGGLFIEPAITDNNITIDFYYPTFGGTLNALFASVRLDGVNVIINNAARNPEVLDVINLLKQMGADIVWENKNTLMIRGVKKLMGTNYSVMPDRIVAATVIAATVVTDGEVTLKNFDSDLLTSEIEVWRNAGVVFEQKGVDLFFKQSEDGLIGTNIETKAYPGFHTDIQPLHTLMMAKANGQSTVKETILDGRFKYCAELVKMGADINVEEGNFLCVNGAPGQIAKVNGVKNFNSAEVKATDIRGGAAVAVAGLAAKGTTKITNLYQLERGYGDFEEVFNSLGANIRRIS